MIPIYTSKIIDEIVAMDNLFAPDMIGLEYDEILALHDELDGEYLGKRVDVEEFYDMICDEEVFCDGIPCVPV